MNIGILVNTVITMLVLILTGFGAARLGIVDERFSKKLSSLIINICQPFLMVSSLIESDFSVDNLIEGATVIAIAAGVHALAIFVSLVSTAGFRNISEKQITQYGMVFSNNAFFGFPVLRAVFGAKGVFWGSFYCVFFNILVWTWGMLVLSHANKSIRISVRNMFLNLGTLSVAVGLVFYIARIPVAAPVRSAMEYLSGLCTPITMLIVGAALSRMKPRQLFLKPGVYYLCLFKLVLIPLAAGGIALLCGFSREMVLFSALMAGMPVAATTGAFAEQYDVASEYASACVGMTTVLSIATIPLTVLVFG